MVFPGSLYRWIRNSSVSHTSIILYGGIVIIQILKVNKRPGLDPFLEALARDYNTIVFTAAMPDYAGPVLDYIDPKGTLFHRRLYRSSCRQVRTQTAAGEKMLTSCAGFVLRVFAVEFFWFRRSTSFYHINEFRTQNLPAVRSSNSMWGATDVGV